MTQPPDFSSIQDTQTKKDSFFSFFSPLIAETNAKVLGHRDEILSFSKTMKEKKALSATQKTRLLTLAAAYRIPEDTPEDAMVRELLLRADIIPPSLALAQAANESAWGTSRFAKEANNYFGQWCFSKGCGLVPAARSAESSHEVKAYATANESVADYIRNLNTHPSYQKLREIRASLRRQNRPVQGEALAEGLLRYSERGAAYVNEIKAMIRHNRLSALDATTASST